MASAVACKAAEMPSGLKKLLAEPSACKAPQLPSCLALERLFGLKSAEGAPVSFYAPRPAAVTAFRRPSTTQTQGKEVQRYDDEDDSSSESDREHEDADSGDRRRASDSIIPSFFSHGDGGAPKNLNELLSLLEGVPSQTGLSSTAWESPLARWVAKEDNDAVYLKVPMPGLAKEHVKARAEKNILVIKGEGEMGPYDSAVPTYNHRIEIPVDAYKMDQIKGEMKNGVLWLTVLKVKEVERKDVFVVKVG